MENVTEPVAFIYTTCMEFILFMSNITPISIAHWARSDAISRVTESHGLSINQLIDKGVNIPVTSLGSTLLHLTMLNPSAPSKDIAESAATFLLDSGADPNAEDEYGRTPLINFVKSNAWFIKDNEAFSVRILELLFSHGADVNIPFTPDYPWYAGCKKWTLNHQLNNVHHRSLAQYLPLSVMTILNSHIDPAAKDNEGRLADVLVRDDLPQDISAHSR